MRKELPPDGERSQPAASAAGAAPPAADRPGAGLPASGGQGLAAAARARLAPLRRYDAGPAGTGGLVALIGIVVLTSMHGSFTGLTLTIGIGYAVVTVGMVLQIGYSHQLAFSQSVFMGIGGYGMGLLETRYGLSTPESILAVLAGAAVVAFVLGSLLIRTSGIALALATMLPTFFLYILATSTKYFGGFFGIGEIPPLWNADDYRTSLVRSGIVAAILLGVTVAVCLRIMRSGVGLQLMVLAADEGLAESMGVNLRRRKAEVFVLCSVLAALGGAIVGTTQGIVSPDLINQSAELSLLLMLFLAGRKSVIAAIAGALVIQYLLTSWSVVSSNLPTIEGIALLIVLIVEPDGAVEGARRLIAWLRQLPAGRWQAEQKAGVS